MSRTKECLLGGVSAELVQFGNLRHGIEMILKNARERGSTWDRVEERERNGFYEVWAILECDPDADVNAPEPAAG